MGIITFYYKSFNCGGLLQAYALVQALNGLGVCAEQISYDRLWDTKKARLRRALSKRPSAAAKKCVYVLKTRLSRRLVRKKNRELEPLFEQRVRACAAFASGIPHSEQVYNRENLRECADAYDAFIAGSDQIWNPDFLQPAYLLDFVPPGKKRIAYAASISKTSLDIETTEKLKNGLAGFDKISVREKQAAGLLKGLAAQPAEWVLDPVLLLKREEWEAVCGETAVKGPYIFCYFLGDDRRLRTLARQAAERRQLPIVTMPFLQNCCSPADENFGDVRLFDAGPGQFLTLIRDAAYVLTDSFHGTVFAEIFGTRYAVFERLGERGMGSRIESLGEILHAEEHFIREPGKITLEELERRMDAPSGVQTGILEDMRRRSILFLKQGLA